MLWFYILRVSEPWHCLLPRQHLDDVYYIAVNVNLPCFNTTVDKNLGFHEFCIWNSYSSFHNIRKICFFCRVGWHCLQGIAIHSEAFLFFLCSNHKGWRFAKWWSSSPNKKSSLSLCCPIESLYLFIYVCSNQMRWRFAKWYSSSPHKKSSHAVCWPNRKPIFFWYAATIRRAVDEPNDNLLFQIKRVALLWAPSCVEMDIYFLFR